MSTTTGRVVAERRQVPLLEWVIGVLGAVLVLGSVGFLAYQGSGGNSTSRPDVRLVADAVVELRHGYLVEVRALNDGRATASQLTLEGVLLGPDGAAIESSQTTLDYLPGRSERAGGLFFARDPRGFDLQLRPLGYVRP